MFSQIGSCPRCGCPIWTYTVWGGIVPPPSMHSCSCAGEVSVTVTTTNSEDPRIDNEKERWRKMLNEKLIELRNQYKPVDFDTTKFLVDSEFDQIWKKIEEELIRDVSNGDSRTQFKYFVRSLVRKISEKHPTLSTKSVSQIFVDRLKERSEREGLKFAWDGDFATLTIDLEKMKG